MTHITAIITPLVDALELERAYRRARAEFEAAQAEVMAIYLEKYTRHIGGEERGIVERIRTSGAWAWLAWEWRFAAAVRRRDQAADVLALLVD